MEARLLGISAPPCRRWPRPYHSELSLVAVARRLACLRLKRERAGAGARCADRLISPGAEDPEVAAHGVAADNDRAGD